jgi:hypothetical protein
MKIKTIYIISLFVLAYLFIIISFNIHEDIKQDNILKSKRTDFYLGTENFTDIRVSIYNIYNSPHNFTVAFYGNGSFVSSITIPLEPGETYGNSRIFRIEDYTSARFEVFIDNQTRPIDTITYDFYEH